MTRYGIKCGIKSFPFGRVGDPLECYNVIEGGVVTLGDRRDHVEAISMNIEKYFRELARASIEIPWAAGRMFEQEHLRFINLITAVNAGGSVGTGCKSCIK